jgi:hypothetical protein
MGRLFRLKTILIITIFLIIVCNGLVTIFADKSSLENDGDQQNFVSINGVVDRIENGELAVILVEEIGLELIVEKNDFDTELAKDTWVNLVLVGEKICRLSIDLEKTKEEKMRVKELKKKLREK